MEVSGQFHAPAALPPRKEPVTHWIADWLGPRAVLDAVVKRIIIPSPRRESNPRTPIIQPVPQPYIFENPFSVEVNDAAVNLHELQYDSVLGSILTHEALINFHASSPVTQFSELHKLAQIWQVSLVAYIHMNRISHV
jgi:hypothetical protein